MSTNNYYNFTHGGTQYGATYTPPVPGSAPAYQATGGYGAQAVPPGQAYPTPGAADPYVIAGYTRPGPTPQQQQQQQSYYNQTQVGGYPKIPQTPRAAATSTVYPTYSANTTGATSSASYAGFNAPQAQTQQNPGTGAKSFTNYDAAVYNAVSAYAQGGSSGRGGGGGMGMKRGGMMKGGMKGSRPMPKPQTLHYCDVCKISCAGPQTYKEHLDGQKHKKKEAAQKIGIPVAPKSGGPAGLRCELCDVTCTGSDAYAAHIRGAKHQKVVKLHTKLGKPIPSDSPTVIATPSGNQSSINSGGNLMKPPMTIPQNNNFTKPVTPKINFVGNKLAEPSTPVSVSTSIMETNKSKEQVQPMSTTYTTPAGPGPVGIRPLSMDETSSADYIEKDVQPVGQDYIEEIRNEEGKVVSFNCKLCECRFNDPNAKEMHMKGRRHRLQYKKKVNPDLVVDVKPSSRQKKLDERRSSRSLSMRKPNDSFSLGGPAPLLPPGAQRGFGPGFGGHSPFYIPPLMRRPETMEDRHVMAKHTEIYPQEDELQAIQKIVSNTEKALKFVSDRFAEEDCVVVKDENGGELPQQTETELQAARKLKGVMRVGHLAKGLLLKGDRFVELVVLCSEKPTMSMLNRVFDCFPKQMEVVAPEEKYELHKVAENAGIKICSIDEPKIEVMVTLTSPLLRSGTEAQGEAQATQVPDPNDLLDKEKCLDALAALRHAKWFQARATTLQSCVIVIRILRDLCRRVPAFKIISCWAVELLIEKSINSAGVPISPGDSLRIVFEVLASGLLLEFGPGLLDPCEKESCDAFSDLSKQAREDITAWSQQALRQIAFRQIHLVLGMEALPRFNKSQLGNRKRRRDPSGNAEGDENEINDGKKDKKDIILTDNVVIKEEVLA